MSDDDRDWFSYADQEEGPTVSLMQFDQTWSAVAFTLPDGTAVELRHDGHIYDYHGKRIRWFPSRHFRRAALQVARLWRDQARSVDG